MKVLISGANGLIGSHLIPALADEGHQIARLVRSTPRLGEPAVYWNPDFGSIDRVNLEGTDVVIHLAGESIADGKWNAQRKAQILDSREQGTLLLCEALADARRPPQLLICASGANYYGDRGNQVLTENSPPGAGFLADVCRRWEAATEPARRRGIRVVNLRSGMVLSQDGGALPRMLGPFRIGLGATLGSGRQYMSWIALDEFIQIISFLLLNEDVEGPVNMATPYPVTNREFTRVLARVLHRPGVLQVPAFALRLRYGELAEDTLLASIRLEPRKLLDSGYRFRYPDLDQALHHVLEM